MVKRVILMRPGETDWNQQGRWQGWVTVPLNAQGRRQVQRLANFVRNIGMSALYSSDLKRAKETAALLAERLGFEPVFDERLRERHIGEWQGMTMAEMQAWYPDEYNQLRNDVNGYQIRDGESRQQVRQRMLAAFNDILAQDRGETVGIISHTTAMRALLSDLIPDMDVNEVIFNNTSVTTLARSDGQHWQLVASNDLMHLEGLASRSARDLEETE